MRTFFISLCTSEFLFLENLEIKPSKRTKKLLQRCDTKC